MFSPRSVLFVSVAVLAMCCLTFMGPLLADEKKTGSIEGTISLNDKPIEKGKVAFHPIDGGKPVEAEIKDGMFKFKDVPVGKVRVTVDFEGVHKAYLDPKMTPLVYEVKPEASQLDLRITAK